MADLQDAPSQAWPLFVGTLTRPDHAEVDAALSSLDITLATPASDANVGEQAGAATSIAGGATAIAGAPNAAGSVVAGVSDSPATHNNRQS